MDKDYRILGDSAMGKQEFFYHEDTKKTIYDIDFVLLRAFPFGSAQSPP